MIHVVVNYLAAQLNQALRRTLRVAEDLVIAAPLHEPDGAIATVAANRLLVFLVNIEREAGAFAPTARASSVAVRRAVTAEPLHLNLLVMFAANCAAANYQEALKLISFTAAYFQSHSLLDHYKDPDLDERIERLTLELEAMTINDLSNLWGVLGGRYLPSVLYRVRMVSVGGQELLEQQARIAQPRVAAAGQGA
jgi:Pvc16 N-terminal domain